MDVTKMLLNRKLQKIQSEQTMLREAAAQNGDKRAEIKTKMVEDCFDDIEEKEQAVKELKPTLAMSNEAPDGNKKQDEDNENVKPKI